MELILYILCGILHLMHSIVIISKKKGIVSTYNYIQTSFVKWSVKRGLNPNGAYTKNIRTIKYLGIVWTLAGCTIIFSPLISTIADLGELPLDHQTHWNTHWPIVCIPSI